MGSITTIRAGICTANNAWEDCLQKAPKKDAISAPLYSILVVNEHLSATSGVRNANEPATSRKRGKKYQEKRRKQREKKLKIYRDNEIDTSQFMGVDYEDSIFIPESLQQSDVEEQVGAVLELRIEGSLCQSVIETLSAGRYESHR